MHTNKRLMFECVVDVRQCISHRENEGAAHSCTKLKLTVGGGENAPGRPRKIKKELAVCFCVIGDITSN